jgi:hypothetical protein
LCHTFGSTKKGNTQLLDLIIIGALWKERERTKKFDAQKQESFRVREKSGALKVSYLRNHSDAWKVSELEIKTSHGSWLAYYFHTSCPMSYWTADHDLENV